MRTVFLLIIILFSTQSFTLRKVCESENKHRQHVIYKQGFVIIQGQFVEIDLYFSPMNGSIGLKSWSLRNTNDLDYNQMRNLPKNGTGEFRRPIPLNQNNKYALQYNFTYYVETFYGPAYYH
jgi:hypothetical protein